MSVFTLYFFPAVFRPSEPRRWGLLVNMARVTVHRWGRWWRKLKSLSMLNTPAPSVGRWVFEPLQVLFLSSRNCRNDCKVTSLKCAWRICGCLTDGIFQFSDKDEEESCRHLALWVLHEDGGWWRLDIQVGSLYFTFSAFCATKNICSQKTLLCLGLFWLRTFICTICGHYIINSVWL